MQNPDARVHFSYYRRMSEHVDPPLFEEHGSLYEQLCTVTKWLADHGVPAELHLWVAPSPSTLEIFTKLFVSRLKVNEKGTYFRTPHGLVRIRDKKRKK